MDKIYAAAITFFKVAVVCAVVYVIWMYVIPRIF